MRTEKPVQQIAILGRLRGLTPTRLKSVLSRAGFELTRSVRTADRVVVAHSWAAKALDHAGALTGALRRMDDKLLSEGTFRRLVGLAPGSPLEGPYSAADLIKVSGLSPNGIAGLTLFDLFEGSLGRFTFSDLALGKRLRNWLEDGFEAPELITAIHKERSSGVTLPATDFIRMPDGRLGTTRHGALSDLNGQMVLPIVADVPDLDQVFDEALAAEQAGAYEQAARLYELAASIDAADPVIAFNYGNVLAELGRPALADIWYRKAVALDRGFSEAWFNIGVLAEARGATERAKRAYQYAILSDPENDAPKYNLARLLTSEEAFSESLPLWEELARQGTAEARMEARKWATLCRLHRNAG